MSEGVLSVIILLCSTARSYQISVCHLGLAVKRLIFYASCIVTCTVHFTVAAHFCACAHFIHTSWNYIRLWWTKFDHLAKDWLDAPLLHGGKKVVYRVDLTRHLDSALWVQRIVCPCRVVVHAQGELLIKDANTLHSAHSGLHPRGEKKLYKTAEKDALGFSWATTLKRHQSSRTVCWYLQNLYIGQTALQVKWGRGWISGWKLMSSLHPPRRLRVQLLFCLLA